jgi:hypothetical protein
MNKILVTLSCLAVLALGAGCGGDIGDSCDESGNTRECVDEAICTAGAGGSATCLPRCTDDTQCAPTESCLGVSGIGNIKSCQPK